jgi:lipopolysaccharide export LptBFGC system permease protein LptF
LNQSTGIHRVHFARVWMGVGLFFCFFSFAGEAGGRFINILFPRCFVSLLWEAGLRIPF